MSTPLALAAPVPQPAAGVPGATPDRPQLPRLQELVAGLLGAVQDVRLNHAQGRLNSWLVICRCWEFGNRPEVREYVAALNHHPDGRPKRCRPWTGHRLAMQAVAATCGLHLKTLERWQTSLLQAVKYAEINPNELSRMAAFNPPQLVAGLEALEARIEARIKEDAQAARRARQARDEELRRHPQLFGEELGRRLIRQAGLGAEDHLKPALMQGLLRALYPVLARCGYRLVCTGPPNPWASRMYDPAWSKFLNTYTTRG